jgi:hypothetical protein
MFFKINKNKNKQTNNKKKKKASKKKKKSYKYLAPSALTVKAPGSCASTAAGCCNLPTHITFAPSI